jgi:hypothetical protein
MQEVIGSTPIFSTQSLQISWRLFLCLIVFGNQILPGFKNTFGWVPFFWGCLIIAIADDLTNIGTTACITKFHGYRQL